MKKIRQGSSLKFFTDFVSLYNAYINFWTPIGQLFMPQSYGCSIRLTLKEEFVSTISESYKPYSFMNKIKDLNLKNTIDDSLIISLYGTIRETLFWFVLLYTYLNKEEKKIIRDKAPMLILLYAKDILLSDIFWVWEQVYDALYQTVMELQPLLELWCWLDDNVQFFELFVKNWKSYIRLTLEGLLYLHFTK